MDMTEKEHQQLQTGRMLRMEADVMMPMLDEKRELAIAKVIMCYRAGETTKLTSAVAELSVTEDMKQTIKNKIRSAEALERKLTNE